MASSIKYHVCTVREELARGSTYLTSTMILDAISSGSWPSSKQYASTRVYQTDTELLADIATGTTIDTGDFYDIYSATIINLDTTNFVDVYYTSTYTAAVNTLRLLPGQFVVLGTDIDPTADITLVADTAACECIYSIYGSSI